MPLYRNTKGILLYPDLGELNTALYDSDPRKLYDSDGGRLYEGGATVSMSLEGVSISTITSGIIGGNDWHGRPNLVELNNGTWVLVYRSATSHSASDGELNIKFSDDYGATWTAENIKLGGGAVTGFPAWPTGAAPGDDYGPGEGLLVLAADNSLHLLSQKIDYDGTPAIIGTYQMSSTDGGEVWGGWSLIDVAGTAVDEVMIQDSYFVHNGVIYVSAGQSDDGSVELGHVRHVFITSSDNAATWDYVSALWAYGDEALEAGIAYIGGTNLIAIARDWNFLVGYKTTSNDMGQTWAALSDITSDVDIIGRPRVWTINQLKKQPQWWADNKLIMCGFVHTVSGSSHPRYHAIWLSEDGGDTWIGPMFLGTILEDNGYGTMAYDSDNDEFVYIVGYGTTEAADLTEYRFKVRGI